MKYLDKDGLLYLWGKIKAKIPTKTSDLTNDSGYLTSHLTAGRSINITNNAINNIGVTDVSVSPNEAGNGTVAVTKGTATGTQTSYIKVKGINNGAYKDIDNTISAGSSSAKLPTSSAVASFVEGKGYIANETDPVFSASASAGITSDDIDNWDGKQDALVSGTNIKTINSQSIVGSGNVDFYGTELPIGTEVDYDGSTAPSGWQEVDSKFNKLLWTGTFNNVGSITVPGISNYRIIMVVADGLPMLGTANYGGMTFATYNAYTVTSWAYRFTYNASNETLTIDNLNRGAVNGSARITITAIYGII